MNSQEVVFRSKNFIPKIKPKNVSKSHVLSSFTQSIHKCRKHGDFVLYPSDKIKGNMGCPDCRKENDSYALSDFIKEARAIHGDKYSYDDNEKYFKNADEKALIKCGKHNYFMMTPKNHLKGKGCKQCEAEEKFVDSAKLIHGDDYNYEEVFYVNRDKSVKIGCKKHGIFECKPLNHLKNEGCSLCKHENTEFIKKLEKIHEGKYLYKNVKKSAMKNKITVTCKEHGDFDITIKAHLNGAGCFNCCNSGSLMPRESKNLVKVDRLLTDYSVKKEKRFSDCRNIYPLPFDRYVKDLNLCIEYDGRQHFENVEFLSDYSLAQQQKHDSIKTEYCIKNGINLLRIKYDQDAEEEVNKMLKLLKKHSGSVVALMYGDVNIYDMPKFETESFYNVVFSV